MNEQMIEVASPAQLRDVPPTKSPAAVRPRPGRANVLRGEMASRRLLGLADALSITIALIVSAIILGGDKLALGALAVPPAFILIAKAMGLYDRDARLLNKTTLDEVPRLIGLSTAAGLLVWLVNGLVVSGPMGRGQIIALVLILFAHLIVLRAAARAVAVRMSPVERCLFVGDPDRAEELRHMLAISHSIKAEVVGWLPVDLSGNGGGAEVPLVEQIRLTILERNVHRVVLGPDASDDELLDSVRRIKENGVKVSVLPDVARLVNSSVEFDRLNGITLLGLRRFELTRSSRLIKRAFDLVGSALALLVVAPLLLIVWLAIRLDSRGPVLFRQPRAGRHGRTFEVLKFRSMVEGADEQKEGLRHLNEGEGVFKIADDPRVTRVGRLIRKMHIDELPQLWNVLRGEMSLVGPRPLPLDEDRRIEGWHRRRLDVSPGITGPWQILGSARVPVREMVRIDHQYVAEWSLWNDVRILLLTLGHVARGRGM